ncbi:MAG: hypothetical protein ABIH23_09940 [bacterium]
MLKTLTQYLAVLITAVLAQVWTVVAVEAQFEPDLVIPLSTSECTLERSDVCPAAFSPDGRTILTGGLALRLWDASTGELIRTYEDDGKSGDFTFSQDGRFVAVAYFQRQFFVKLWDLKTGEITHTLEYTIPRIPNYDSSSRKIAMAFSPDGRQLLTGDVVLRLLLWSTETGEIIREYFGVSDRPYAIEWEKVEFLPDGKRAILCNGHTYLFDLENDQIIHEMVGGKDFSLSPDGARFLIPSSKAFLYDTETWQLIRSYPVEYSPATRTMALSPDEKLILVRGYCYSDEYYPREIIDTETGEQLRKFPKCDDRVLEFSPDGKRFLTVDRLKHGVCIYDVSDLQSAVREAPEYER